MLLGDINPSIPATKERPFQGGLDVLHAISMALVDACREVLLDKDTDTENMIKVISSQIPVNDEDILMRVARAEWKLHKEGKHERRVVPVVEEDPEKAEESAGTSDAVYAA